MSHQQLAHTEKGPWFNPIALRMAKTLWSFGHSKCNRVILQGSYASGKCQGNLKFFKVRELSGNFIICQGKLNFC